MNNIPFQDFNLSVSMPERITLKYKYYKHSPVIHITKGSETNIAMFVMQIAPFHVLSTGRGEIVCHGYCNSFLASSKAFLLVFCPLQAFRIHNHPKLTRSAIISLKVVRNCIAQHYANVLKFLAGAHWC